jgi:hypothetical protein
MRLVMHLLKKRKNSLSLLILLFPLFIYSQNMNSTKVGYLRIYLDQFPYSQHEGSWRSYDNFGRLRGYVIRIYSEGLIEQFHSANETSIEMTGKKGMVQFVSTEKGKYLHFGPVVINSAKELDDEHFKKESIKVFSNDCALTYAVPRPAPLFVDIPLPEGIYFLAYSLEFSKIGCVEQQYTDYDSSWGPPSVRILNNQITKINLTPSTNVTTSTGYSVDQHNWNWDGTSVMSHIH